MLTLKINPCLYRRNVSPQTLETAKHEALALKKRLDLTIMYCNSILRGGHRD